MANTKRLVVGLGNPGAAYADTRHNVGFEVVDAVATRIKAAFDDDRVPAQVAWGRWRSRVVGLAKPTTYMNLSGEAVRALTRAYQPDLSYLLVVVDDINLPLGTIRLRPGGSAGGHNGTQDIIDHLGTDAFARLRIGIGNDFPQGYQADYVLTPFSSDERPLVDEAVARAREAVLTFVTDGIARAMNRYNRKPA